MSTAPASATRAESESLRRAARKLAASGLATTTQQRANGRGSVHQVNVQHVRLTTVGGAIVDYTWADLADGRRIRWPDVLERIRRRVRLRGIALARLFVRNIRFGHHRRGQHVRAYPVPSRVLDALKQPRKPADRRRGRRTA